MKSTIQYLTQEQFTTNIKEITTQYNNIYVSIGGKFNEPTVNFNYPSIQKNQKFSTNAYYQLIPAFLRNVSDNHNLVIVVDDFSNTENKEINCKILDTIIESSNSTMDIILLNTYNLIQQSINSIIESIIDLAKNLGILPKNTMFCNYIVFRNPNEQEYKLEEMLPIQIQNILDRENNKEYCECFYQWYGMTFYFYNLVYQYKKYSAMRSVFISELLHLCDIVKFSQPICKEDIGYLIDNLLTSSYQQQKRVHLLRKLQMFNANNIDICN